MWAEKKKFVVEIDEKYVDQKKHQMVTYIIGKAYDKKCLRRNIKKKLSDVDRQKKNCFPLEVKKKLQATKTLATPPPPPQISNGASLKRAATKTSSWTNGLDIVGLSVPISYNAE